MIEARFVPIELWPGDKTRQRKNSPFRGTWANTLATLERELRHLRARSILVQTYMQAEHIRNDGWPRSGIPKPPSPGVIVSFDSSNGALSFPCDTFTDWQDNLRAIALGLSALRAVERYGVTRRQEQYKGWAKLSAPDPNQARNSAILFITKLTGWDQSQILADLNGAYRLAAAAAHPDKGGSHELFVQLGNHIAALK